MATAEEGVRPCNVGILPPDVARGRTEVPHIFHQSWKTCSPSPTQLALRATCASLNPSWATPLWDDLANRQLLNESYAEFIPWYDSLKLPIHRADAARFFYLHRFGGVYLDLDFVCLRPLEDALSGCPSNAFIVASQFDPAYRSSSKTPTNQAVANAFMAAPPRHPFTHYLMRRLRKYAAKSSDWPVMLGPPFMTAAIHAYKRERHYSTAPVVVLDFCTIYGVQWNEEHPCSADRLHQCAQHLPQSVTTTLWMKSWSQNRTTSSKLAPAGTCIAGDHLQDRAGDSPTRVPIAGSFVSTCRRQLPPPPSPPPPPPPPPPPCITDGIRTLPSHVQHVHATPWGKLARVHILLNTTGTDADTGADAYTHAYTHEHLAGCQLDATAPDSSASTGHTPSTRVALCHEDAPQSSSQPAHAASQGFTHASVALCIPPLYGKVSPAVLHAHIAHHKRIGVGHAYFYTTPALHCGSKLELAEVARNAEGAVSVFDLPWVDKYKGMQSFHGNSGAQVWALNDCIHRAAADGFEWSLNVDLDEFLFLNGAHDIGGLLQIAQHELDEEPWLSFGGHRAPMEVVTFGSRRARSPHILALLPPANFSTSAGDAFLPPDCDSRPPPRHIRTDTCPGWHGHRKHLVRTHSVFLAVVHHIHQCWMKRRRASEPEPYMCRPVEMNASQHVWLEHASRGAMRLLSRHARITPSNWRSSAYWQREGTT